jgi:hypothetical protein
VRLWLELAALIVLAAAYVATGSELAQGLVLFGWLLIVLPVARRIFQPTEPDEHWLVVRERAYPASVFAPAVLAMLVMIAVGSVVLDLAPGRWFWTFVFLAVSFEFQDVLARRHFRIRGSAGWDDAAPLSHSGLAGVVTVPLVSRWRCSSTGTPLWMPPSGLSPVAWVSSCWAPCSP